jgi:uncharacterized lipoprotein YajG
MDRYSARTDKIAVAAIAKLERGTANKIYKTAYKTEGAFGAK